jgi:hypothetical protein
VSSRSWYPHYEETRCRTCVGRHTPETLIWSKCWQWPGSHWLLQGWHPCISERNTAPGKGTAWASVLLSTELLEGMLHSRCVKGPPAVVRFSPYHTVPSLTRSSPGSFFFMCAYKSVTLLKHLEQIWKDPLWKFKAKRAKLILSFAKFPFSPFLPFVWDMGFELRAWAC